jgi:elongation factor P
MIDTGDLRKGLAIELEGDLYVVLDWSHIKMGRGSAQVRLKLRNLKRGDTIERTFQAGSKFLRARVENRPAQFLYRDGDFFTFMDTATYDQVTLDAEQIGDAVNYLKEGMEVQVVYHDGNAIGIELPRTVDLRVVETAPGFRGDTATAGSKPARLETGITVQVPFFVDVGEVIRVDTTTGEYVERVSG